MKYECVNPVGLDYLTAGAVYRGKETEQGMVEVMANNGKIMECFRDRFETLGEEPDERCRYSTTMLPPCSYCENGGWCGEHGEFRHDCGCEWDEVEEY